MTDSLRILTGPDADLLAELYVKLKHQGLTQRVFHEGGGNVLAWLDWLGRRSPMTAVAVDRHGAPLGAGWINAIVDHCANCRVEVSCVFLKETGAWRVVEAARQMLSIVSSKFHPRLILATVAEPNRAASVLAKRLGFELFARLPEYSLWQGNPCTALIYGLRALT